MNVDRLKWHLENWWRDASWPEPTLHQAETIRGRLERDEITAAAAAAELRLLEATVADPVLKGRLILAATQLVDRKVLTFKR